MPSDEEYADAYLDRLLDEAAKRFEQTKGSNEPVKKEDEK